MEKEKKEGELGGERSRGVRRKKSEYIKNTLFQRRSERRHRNKPAITSHRGEREQPSVSENPTPGGSTSEGAAHRPRQHNVVPSARPSAFPPCQEPYGGRHQTPAPCQRPRSPPPPDEGQLRGYHFCSASRLGLRSPGCLAFECPRARHGLGPRIAPVQKWGRCGLSVGRVPILSVCGSVPSICLSACQCLSHTHAHTHYIDKYFITPRQRAIPAQ